MWIEIKTNEKKMLINMKKIRCVESRENGLIFHGTTNYEICLNTYSIEESRIFYDGLTTALNGLDFIWESNYIKPLFHAKNESLYRYLMLKECLGENKP